MSYDQHGRKIAMDDPDKGHWEYDYNDFGELIEQRDAMGATESAGQRTVMVYDALGRMSSRQDYDLSNTEQSVTGWTYHPQTELLESINHSSTLEGDTSTHQTALFYDSYGRAISSTVTINGTGYEQRTTYDQYGRVYQSFDASGNDRGTQYSYNSSGYLIQLREAQKINGSQALYAEYTAMDAWGHIIEEKLGNGLTTTRAYDIETGRLNAIVTSLAGLPAIQDLDMHYDVLGNLVDKTNYVTSTTENYCYDTLNRLTGDCASTQYQYDSLGNITVKDTVDDYTYGSVNTQTDLEDAGPHAVTSAGGINYYYNNNGSMTRDSSGRILSYTVFEKPYSISKGSDIRIDFRYGPNRSRYRRIDTDGANNSTTTTHYLGSVEFINRNGEEEVKRYIGGHLVVTEKRDSAGQLLSDSEDYLLKDHLGSTDVIVGPNGNEQRVSFDAWGQRRDAEDLPVLLTQAGWAPINLVTTRGFTDHEMLDAVGLVHMNGRIYDARLGRFLQADPFVQYVDNTQSFNRYSYVLNNPLAYIDPSGYLSFKQALSIVVTVIVAIYCEPCAAGFWETVATGAALGGFNAALFGGNIGQGIALGAFTAAATYGIAQSFEGTDIATTSRETADVVSDATSTHMAGDPVTADVVSAGSSGGSLEQAGINRYPTGQVPESYTGRTAWVDNSVAPSVRFEPLAGGVRSGGISEWNMIITAKTGLSPLAQAAIDAAAVVSSAVPVLGALRNAKTIGQISRGRSAANSGTETVQRWMSRAELEATKKTGLMRGGREGTHYVTDSANKSAIRARMRTSLNTTPEVRVTMEVPAGKFSPPSIVKPKYGMPGGGMERTATGEIPVTIK